MYEEDNVNRAYNAFINTFISLYNKNCPNKEVSKKQKYTDKVWITKGVQNACKKRTHYREFIKYRTIETENKYKRFKNKLI